MRLAGKLKKAKQQSSEEAAKGITYHSALVLCGLQTAILGLSRLEEQLQSEDDWASPSNEKLDCVYRLRSQRDELEKAKRPFVATSGLSRELQEAVVDSMMDALDDDPVFQPVWVTSK